MKRWYVVQVYAGFEEAIKADIEKQIKEGKLEEYFGDVLVPSAKMKNQFGAEDSEDQQLFPGSDLCILARRRAPTPSPYTRRNLP